MDDKPNPLLVWSAVLYFLAGVAALFAPQELLMIVASKPAPPR